MLFLSSVRTRTTVGALENLSASCPWAIFPRKKLDITYRDVAAGLQSCFTLRESQRDECERRLTSHWDPSGHSMVTLSVRYALCLLCVSVAMYAFANIGVWHWCLSIERALTCCCRR